MPGDDTNGKINVYNLGEKGVNVSKSPLHIDDGELVSAQNAEFFQDEGLGAIRKRPGLQRLNSGSVLAGSVLGVLGVPLPGPGQRSVYAQRPGTPWFRKTTDGTTFADTTGEFQRTAGCNPVLLHSSNAMFLARPLLNQFFYPSALVDGGITYGLLNGFDGVSEYEILRFASPGAFRVLCTHNDKVVIATQQEVFVVDPVTVEMSKLGSTFAGIEEVECGVSYQGKIWIGTAAAAASTGKLYSAREGETAWTAERTAAAGQNAYLSLCVFNGELYAGTTANAPTAAIVEKRTAGGTWSTDRTGSVATEWNGFDGLAVANSILYAGYFNPAGGSSNFCEIQKRSGGVWSVDKNLQPDGRLGIHGVVVAGRTIFYNTFDLNDDTVYRKFSSGSFTAVDTTLGTPTYGVMGVL